METSKTLKEVLDKFGSLASSEDLLLEKMVEQLKAWPYCKNYQHDMKMINAAESALIRMLQLNTAFHMKHNTAKQLLANCLQSL